MTTAPIPYIRWLTLFALVSLLLVVAPEPADSVAVTAFCRAHKLTTPGARGQDLGDFAPGVQARSAEDTYLRVIARRPRDPQPWRGLGDLYVAQGRLDDARQAYDQALARGDSAALDQSLAQLYALLDDEQQSSRHWTAYLARRPDDRAARLALAQSAIRQADWERARAELERLVVDGDPTDLLAHAWLGLLLVAPEPLAASPHLQRAAQDPNLAALLAPVFDAERLSAASDDPAYRSALLGMAFLANSPAPQNSTQLEAKTTAMLALRSLSAATQHNPAYADAYAYMGQALGQLGQAAWARAMLDHALRLAPQSPVVLTLAGLYWDRHGEPALARQHYQAANEQDPDNPALCLEIAATFAAEGEYTAAEVWLLHAVEQGPDDPQAWEALAHFYLDTGIDVKESGLAAAARWLELAPQDARAHDLMGWAYFLAQKDEQAQASLSQAQSLAPTLASAHYHLGRLYARQGHYAAAALAYRQAAFDDVGGELAAQLERAWSDLPPAYRDNGGENADQENERTEDATTHE